MQTYLHQLAVEQLEALAARNRFIFVHPNYTEQHLLLSSCLDREKTYYVRFSGDQINETAAITQIEDALQHQLGQKTLPDDGLVLLDEFDRISSDSAWNFLSGFAQKEGNCRCLIFSRRLPTNLLADKSLLESVVFLPTDRMLMLADYAEPREEDVNLLEVRSFGEGHVYLNGVPVDNWDGVLPRSLFFFLVDRGMTTRNEIFETFWPTLPIREATNVFHVTKRKISEVLGVDLTAYWSGFYRISPKIQLNYDVVQFTETVNESAILPPTESATMLARGLHLYRGHFLSAMDMPWVMTRRAELALDYGEALAMLAKAREDAGKTAEALGLYLTAAAYNRNREDLTTSIMMLYRQMGKHSDALTVYERLSDGLQAELGVAPAPNVQQLAADIRNEMNGSSE